MPERTMNLLPAPRYLKIRRGTVVLPKNATDWILGSARWRATVGVPPAGIRLDRNDSSCPRDARAPRSEFYALTISPDGINISFYENAGLRAASATLRQLVREHGRHLPCLKIRDWPDFPRRGVMLDISRGRVPKLETLLDFAERLADFKINELQLYTEHTFAYRKYKSVWRDWSALTAADIRKLDARCRQLGIDLVPNQNSFGHLRYFLEHPKLKELAEVSEAYEDPSGKFVRRPTTLAPNHPGTLPFLRKLYDELLPNFSSRFFNVGCDETWDLGRGQSRELCQRLGNGRVYLNFLKQIHHEVSARGRRMMFWGDIILKYSELIPELAGWNGQPARFEWQPASRSSGKLPEETGQWPVPPKPIALNWGYEANHPFERECREFAKSGIEFYVCPGTSTWQTLIGRHDNALANLRRAADAGRKHGARGYLITDWGDGGHPQPLAVSWLPIVAGASLSWCARSFDERLLAPVLSRDVFNDASGRAAKAATALGLAHRLLRFKASNCTPIGCAIAASEPGSRELFCHEGSTYFSRIAAKNIRATLREIEKNLRVLETVNPPARGGRVLLTELKLAARMAAQSCKWMLWQKMVASGKGKIARRMAQTGISELRKLCHDFDAYWPSRNKGTTKKCSAFLQWRIDEYRAALRQ